MTGTQTSILIVDDDEIILETVADYLRLSGYEVMTATNGNDGLQSMHSHIPDLVLSDITMPDVDGYQFYERIRQNPEWGTIPFIFMSAKGEQYDLRLGYGIGADAYLTKPFDLEDLQVAVQSRLQRVREITTAAQSDVEHMKRQLMTVFGHELRTPLTYIYGYVSLMKDDLGQLSDDAIQDMLSGVERGAKRLMHLVEDLMLLMQIESGITEFEIKRYRTTTELGVLIAEVVAAQSLKAEAQNISIEVQVPDSLLVHCLPAYLQDVISRLLDNAIKFSKIGGGHVLIYAQEVGNHVRISVQDDGIGIDPTQHSQLFQRFKQLNRETMEQQGLGMGLAIAGALIELHNGSISVESASNEGSIFTIALP
jgi:two-component system, sensor histidine kinase and response regulator